ncbi:hypothetical protein GBN32_17325 [Plesiomonas shigelloides]|uniref:putative phage abortive infection protein n=1 Tax=Plesiomonas shigelloides TaxID=703 RepID=UPI00126261F5|nr:hypothetical protein [Plesiomonas shigelloides]KAB7704850.1 hypothetical protein GBN32_17325 [Plesiomonas shigelloides]
MKSLFLIFALIISFIFAPSLIAVIFPSIKNLPNLSATSSFVSAMATVIICHFTVKSVQEVIKSNNENKKNNEERDRKETFERKFSLLLQEHNNYLSRLIRAENPLYELDYILNCPGYESRSIIRGNVKFITIDGSRFYYSNDIIFVRIKIWCAQGENKVYVNPTQEQIDSNNLKEFKKLKDTYATSDTIYYYSERHDTMSEMSCLSMIMENQQVKDLVKHEIQKGIKKAPQLIKKNNEISKNILSPYMRIIYHILKLSNNNSSENGMKEYTNIIRSIIPYDVLMLVAINAMNIYKLPNDSKNEIKRWGDTFNELDDLSSCIFNDYHKYYQLLVKCDFFEHLIMDFSDAKMKLKNVKLDIALSENNVMVSNRKDASRDNQRYLILRGSTHQNLLSIYKKFNTETMKLSTDMLIALFYFNRDKIIETTIKNIMSDVINDNSKGVIITTPKSKLHRTISTYNTIAYKKHSIMSLSRDFYTLYTQGELPEITENQCDA